MTRARTLLLAVAGAVATSGCVAAIPVVAAGAIGKSRLDRRDRQTRPQTAVAAPVRSDVAVSRSATKHSVAPPQPAIVPLAPPPPPVPAVAEVPSGMQFLYGSGEAAALSLQAYQQLGNFLLARQADRQIGNPTYSAVLSREATIAKPVFEPCGNKPLAIILDVDETALLNEGFEADQIRNGGRYDAARWDAWEKTGANAVRATPGVAQALATARSAGIKVIFNSNRSAANADGTAAALKQAGLGSAMHGDTLWLKGDAGGGDGKDARRWAISAKYCVVAMAGDQLGDFSDLFNSADTSIRARRTLVANERITTLWGQGWFVLPNPVYGTGLKGGVDEVFPADKRWRPQ